MREVEDADGDVVLYVEGSGWGLRRVEGCGVCCRAGWVGYCSARYLSDWTVDRLPEGCCCAVLVTAGNWLAV